MRPHPKNIQPKFSAYLSPPGSTEALRFLGQRRPKNFLETLLIRPDGYAGIEAVARARGRGVGDGLRAAVDVARRGRLASGAASPVFFLIRYAH